MKIWKPVSVLSVPLSWRVLSGKREKGKEVTLLSNEDNSKLMPLVDVGFLWSQTPKEIQA